MAPRPDEAARRGLLACVMLPPPTTGMSLASARLVEGLLRLARQGWPVDMTVQDVTGLRDLRHSLAGGHVLRKAAILTPQLWRFVRALFSTRRPGTLYVTLGMTAGTSVRDLIFAALARRRGLRVVGHVHSSALVERARRGGLIERRLLRALIARQDQLLFCTEGLAAAARAEFPGLAAAGVDNAVPPAGVRRAPREAGPFRVVMLSMLTRDKGTLVLLDACAELKRLGTPVAAKLVGTWCLDATLAELLRERGLDSHDVTHLGELYGEAKMRVLAQSDALVLPTSRDAQPLVLLEAFSVGLPVIATRRGGIPETLSHGREGLLLDEPTPAAVAAAIARLAAAPAEAAAMGDRAFELWSARYRPERHARAVAALLFPDLAVGRAACDE